MLKNISQQLVFPNTHPSILYEFYTNPKKHTEVIGYESNIASRSGIVFSVCGDFCFGKNLHLQKDKLIVQTWKAENWDALEDYSIVIMRFELIENDTHLFFSQINIPEDRAAWVKKAWNDYYWKPWREYLKKNKE